MKQPPIIFPDGRAPFFATAGKEPREVDDDYLLSALRVLPDYPALKNLYEACREEALRRGLIGPEVAP